MKRILVTSTDVMMLQFLVPHVFELQKEGYYVEVACSNVEGHIEELHDIFQDKVKMTVVELQRSPFQISNCKGFKQLKELIKKGRFDLLWTNEPVMGIMSRFAARVACGNRIKLLYIAHGFHFYKGAPVKNWVLFYPIEKVFSKITNEIITINEEDYQRAKKKFHHPVIKKFPGIGVDTKKFFSDVSKENIDQTRKALGLTSDEMFVLSVGELEKRKNHETSIRAFKVANIPNAKLFICGLGSQRKYLDDLICNLSLKDKVFLLGYRTDVNSLCHAADLFLFSTFQEGLSVALMEAMSSGSVCMVSKIRGNTDLVEEGMGIYINPYSIESCANAMKQFFNGNNDFENAILYNKEKIKAFDFTRVHSLLETEIRQLIM